MRPPLSFSRVTRAAAAVSAAVLSLALVGSSAPANATVALAGRPGLARTLAAPTQDGVLLGVATFDAPPSLQQVSALGALGLRTQALRRLPMAFVYGTKPQMQAAVTTGIARDVYPNERLHWFSDVSDRAIRADEARMIGIDGRGIGVAIVDSGIDATHPALADRVTHNRKIVGPEYLSMAGIPVDPSVAENSIAVPVDQLPYDNSDSASGHGTHVAGIVAANGDDPGHPALVGVAPRADLIGYSTGDAAFVITILAAYDDILLHHDDWHIRVVNNSWGSSFRLFDPNDPINVATKQAHDAGLVVAFAAGNDTDEATINPYSVAPWVISVGAGTVSKQRSDFSSGGLRYDDSMEAALPADKHVHFNGDRLGLYHPDVSAPGTNIVSTGTPTGAYVGPTAPGGEATASGTSMATPHVAGVAALVLQAADAQGLRLNPDQVRTVMQVTSVPMADGSAFWQSGYGYVDAKAAVDFVQHWSASALRTRQAALDAAVKGARDWKVAQSDLWSFSAAPVTAGGTDAHSLTLTVPRSTKGVYATVEFPTTPLIGVNGFEYAMSLRDAGGHELATSTASSVAGVSTLFVDTRTLPTPAAYGTWTLDVTGELGASDPNILLGNTISVTAAQLQPQANTGGTPATTFTPTGTRGMYFTPAIGATSLPVASPEGCATDVGAPVGGLATARAIGTCHSGNVGYATNYGAGTPATFTSGALASPVTIGGTGTVTLTFVDAAQPAWSPAFSSGLAYTLYAVDGSGTATPVAAGDAPENVQAGATPVTAAYTIDVPPTTVPAGSKLQLELQVSGVYTSTMRVLYGGGAYAGNGLTLTTGTIG